jgi:hypothetical protein
MLLKDDDESDKLGSSLQNISPTVSERVKPSLFQMNIKQF